MWLDFKEEQLNIIAWSMIVLGIVLLVYSFFLTVPYGRYSRYVWGFGIDARLAWLLQEFPSFIIPFVLFLRADGMKELMSLNVSPNIALLSMFLVHYFRR